MAKATVHVIEALREAATQLEKSDQYQWGHMGQCNCGFLAQTITQRSPRAIHAAAMQGHGDWSEQLNDYCPTSGFVMDSLISDMLAFGFDRDDLIHLERLSDSAILSRLPSSHRHLRHNHKADVVTYLRAWSQLLEEEWAMEQPMIAITPAFADAGAA